MRTSRRAAGALFAASLLVALASAVAPRPSSVYACSIGSPVNYAESGIRNASRAQLLFVGTVTDERTMGRSGDSTLFESKVRPEAVLLGDAPDEPVPVGYLGHLGADCSGGPRLKRGERVLIPVHYGRASYGNGEMAWQLTGIFSKVLLEDGEATLQWHIGSQPLGDVETVVRQWGEAAGASEEQIEAAVSAARAPSEISDGWTWRIVALVAICVALAAVVVVSLRRRPDLA